jgi:hypothetical protein
MSIFEEYTSNIPLFFPSKEFGKELFHKKIMFNDLTFYRYFNIQEPDDMNCPNSLRNDTILNMWFDTCDFYDEENMPYLYYFNSIDHLNILLTTLTIEDLIITSKKMEEFNKKRKEYVYSEWTKILNTIK